MASEKKKAMAKAAIKFKDLKSKRNPKGGNIGSQTGGAGAGKIKLDLKWG